MSPGAITLLVIAICLVPLAGLFGAMDAALQRVSKARVDELRREGVKRAKSLEQVVADRARHVSLLLLLRIVCETLATVLVTVVLFDVWGADVTLVEAELTLADTVPAMAELRPLASQVRGRAHELAGDAGREMARAVAEALARVA